MPIDAGVMGFGEDLLEGMLFFLVRFLIRAYVFYVRLILLAPP
jgi:hypothetical protein